MMVDSRTMRRHLAFSCAFAMPLSLGFSSGDAAIEPRAHSVATLPHGGVLHAQSSRATSASPDSAAPVIQGPNAEAIRLFNTQRAFAPGNIGSAPPFFFPDVDKADRARAVDCLAAAAYYEAGRSHVGQRAVVQVVLNRLRHPIFPHSVCGVVFQGSERTTGCQFTFTCDGAMARRRPSSAAWQEAQQVAQAALEGSSDPDVGYATHYHTDWVLPVWSLEMDKVAAVESHLFFRWRNGAGRPGAFLAHYAGGEPRIASMAPLSAAHQAGSPATALALAQATVPSAGLPGVAADMRPLAHITPTQMQGQDPDVFLMKLDPGGSAESFVKFAQRICAGKDYCKFIGWVDPRRVAERLPISGSAIDAISFTYQRSAPGLADQARWNCQQFPRADQTQCLRRGT
jgi:spore germination cell wall hydrolase CwlJ-like protein